MGDVIIEQDGGVLRLTLNRPGKKNALTKAMYATLTEGFDRAAGDDAVRAVIIGAAGDDFCAGNDIFDFAQDAPALLAGDVALEDVPVFRFLKALTYFPKPLVSAVHGQAVGVGVTLLLHCDLVAMAGDARLSLPFLKLGLVPEAGSTLLLPRRIGHARAFAWMALGEVMNAEDAKALGLVNTVVDRDALEAAVSEMTAKIVRLAPAALRHTKAFMRDPDTLWQVVLAEGEVFRQMLASPEAMAAFSAFLKC